MLKLGVCATFRNCQVFTQGTGRRLNGNTWGARFYRKKGKLPKNGAGKLLHQIFKRLWPRRVLTEIGRGRNAVLLPMCASRSRTGLGPVRVSNGPDESLAADRRCFPSRSVQAKGRTPPVRATRQVRSLRPVQTVLLIFHTYSDRFQGS